MIHRQAKVSAEDVANLGQFERSIDHWSKQIAKALIQVDDMKGTLRAIYLARQKVFETAYKEAGIDPMRVKHAELKDDGTLNVLLHEEMPASPPPSNGSPQ